MKKITFLITIFAISLIAFPKISLAASVFLANSSSTPHVGDTFEVLVKIDTGGVAINSVDLSLNYDKEFLVFSGYKDDQSVVRLWVSSPHEEKSGLIEMSGIIPGGVSGLYDANKNGLGAVPVVSLLFTAQKEGTSTISFQQTKVLEHDGKGTELIHDQKPIDITILSKLAVSPILGGPQNPIDSLSDKIPPAVFDISFVDSSFFSKTPSMIIFNTNDVGSGVKNYQMQIGDGLWFDTQSPQPLLKSIFSRTITVRAFDFNGNYRDSVLYIPGIVSTQVMLFILLFLVLSGILVLKLLKYKA